MKNEKLSTLSLNDFDELLSYLLTQDVAFTHMSSCIDAHDLSGVLYQRFANDKNVINQLYHIKNVLKWVHSFLDGDRKASYTIDDLNIVRSFLDGGFFQTATVTFRPNVELFLDFYELKSKVRSYANKNARLSKEVKELKRG